MIPKYLPTSSFPRNYWIPFNGHLKSIKGEYWLRLNSVLTLLPITPECNLDKILLLLLALVYLCANLVPVLQIDTICKVDVLPLFIQVYIKQQLTEKFHGIRKKPSLEAQQQCNTFLEIYFSNFSCMFLNPNNFFQFEF